MMATGLPTREIEVEDMLVADLDLRKLGHLVFRLPLIAVQMGHESLKETDVYLHPTTLEARFATDVIKLGQGRMRTEAFCEKWFAGPDGALELLSRVWEQM